MRRKWDVSNDTIKRKCVEEVITRVKEQDGAEFGVIAAQEIIDIIIVNLAPDVYNLALEDAKKLITNKLADIETDLDLLDQQ